MIQVLHIDFCTKKPAMSSLSSGALSFPTSVPAIHTWPYRAQGLHGQHGESPPSHRSPQKGFNTKIGRWLGPGGYSPMPKRKPLAIWRSPIWLIRLGASPRPEKKPSMDEQGKNTASTIQNSWCKLCSWFKTRVHQQTHEIGHFGRCFNMFWPFIFGRWIILVYTLIPIDCWQFFPWLVNPLFYFSSCSFFWCGFAWPWKAWYALTISFKRESDDQPESTFKEIHWKSDQPCSWSLITITEILFSQWLLASRLIYCE